MTRSNVDIFLGPLLWYKHLISLIRSNCKIFRHDQKTAYSIRNEIWADYLKLIWGKGLEWVVQIVVLICFSAVQLILYFCGGVGNEK